MISHYIFPISLIILSVVLAIFCIVLSRRIRKLNDLESGLGGAIAVMVSEVNRLDRSIHSAGSEAKRAIAALNNEVQRATSERKYWEAQSLFFNHEDPGKKLRARRRNRHQEEVADV